MAKIFGILVMGYIFFSCSSKMNYGKYMIPNESNLKSDIYVNDNYCLKLYMPNVYYPIRLAHERQILNLSNDHFNRNLEHILTKPSNVLAIYQNHDSLRFFFYVEDVSSLGEIKHESLYKKWDYKSIENVASNQVYGERILNDSLFQMTTESIIDTCNRKLRFVLNGYINYPIEKISEEHILFEKGVLLNHIDFILNYKSASENNKTIIGDPHAFVYNYWKDSGYNYIKTYNLVENNYNTNSKNPAIKNVYSTFSSYLGRHDLVKNLTQKSEFVDEKELIEGVLKFPFNQKIIHEAERASVIIINEAHDISFHRSVTMDLVTLLRPLGYRYLALETLNPHDSTINSRGYPLAKSGYYTSDPTMSNLIRRAKREGYTLVAYEAIDYSKRGNGESVWQYRERAQAENLIKQLDISDTSKAIIHVGYGHGLLNSNKSTTKLMGEYLKETYNDRILSFDQTLGLFREDLFLDSDYCHECPTKRMIYSSNKLNSMGISYGIIDFDLDKFQNCPEWEYKLGSNRVVVSDHFPQHRSKDYLLVYDRSENDIENSGKIPIIICQEITEIYLASGSYYLLSLSSKAEVNDDIIIDIK